MTTKTSSFRPELTAEVFNGRSRGHLPGIVGVEILEITPELILSRLPVRREVMAPNGFLHAATVEGSEAKIALFRCTQMVLWPK